MKNTILLIACFVLLAACGAGQSEPLNMDNSGQEIVCFGDSLTQGVGAEDGNTYPFYLSQQLNAPVVNLGFSGMTSEQARAAFSRVRARNPYMVLIEFGGNDFMRGVPLESTKANIAYLVDEVQKLGAIAVVVDTGGVPQMAAYSKAFKQIAADKKAVFVPGIMNSIFRQSGYKSDEIHPNSAGYQIVAHQVFSEISPFLKKDMIK